MVCEKCWADAFGRSRNTGRTQTECYYELLEERKDNPCKDEPEEVYDCCIHGKLGGIDECPRC